MALKAESLIAKEGALCYYIEVMIMALKRCLIVATGLCLQLGFALLVQLFFREHVAVIGILYEALGVAVVLEILKDSKRLSNDLPWVILILLFPIFGIAVLLMLGRDFRYNKLLRSLVKTEKNYAKYLRQDPEVAKAIKREEMDNLRYILDCTTYPISQGNQMTYYDFGEKFYPELLKELKKAKKFIFMEYFIINEGRMWGGILDILKEKVTQGVEVRVLYDDVGSLALLSTKYPKELAKFGIKCIPFNKLSPFKGLFMNNRDHRKMTIIDGKVAFSGGLNLSDEYINLDNRLGVWKDNGIKIVGEAIWNLTVMFLTMWNANVSEDDDWWRFRYDFAKLKGSSPEEAGRWGDAGGFVVPYGLSPIYGDTIGEDIYINIINSAKDYLYIMTPYLVVDTDMVNALIRAAKRGVNVRIVVPGVPDKKIVYTLTTSFFKPLVDGGVKIFRFDEGFVHSKVLLADDARAVVGTINMDYRSLYLHFENGIYMENVAEIGAVKKDFNVTIPRCHDMTKEDVKVGVLRNLWQAFLRLFAPLF